MGTYTPMKGTQFKWTISAVLTKIDQVENITAMNPTRQEIIVFGLDAGPAERPVAGNIDWGQVTFLLHYDPANSTHQALLSDFGSDTARAAQILFADAGAATADFTARILSMPFQNGDHTKVQDIQVTVGIDGAVTIAP